ncbi:MAG TPA: sulfotransferase [Bryobacteraceae bacterium]
MTAAPARQALDGICESAWRPFEENPGPLVFLMGCQRSGTTFLHLQLARSGAFRFLSALDVYSADRLVYNRLNRIEEQVRTDFAARLTQDCRDRGIDAIPASPDTPEEYGLLFANARGGAVRYEKPDTTPETLDALRELCAKKSFLEGTEKPLLLKSPPDYPFGISPIAGVWPHAKFILIHRHPLATLQSQVNAWRKAVRHRNPYLALIDTGYRDLFSDAKQRMATGMFLHSQAGVEWIAGNILRAHQGFLSMADSLAGQLLETSYEEMCLDQKAVLQAISRHTETEISEPVAKPAPRSIVISDEVRQAFDKRAGEFEPYLDHCNYRAEIA